MPPVLELDQPPRFETVIGSVIPGRCGDAIQVDCDHCIRGHYYGWPRLARRTRIRVRPCDGRPHFVQEAS